jgi:hypothetical protein
VSAPWVEHDHPSLTSPDAAGTGNGLRLFIRVENFDEVLKRARDVAGGLAGEPYVNPNTGTMELSLRDPDGYYVSISAADKDWSKKMASCRANGHDHPTCQEVQIR